MSCIACINNKENSIKTVCFETALDVIKKHFLFYKDAAEEKEHAIQMLQTRNEKLMKAIELLQQQQNPSSPTRKKKRRRASGQQVTATPTASQVCAESIVIDDTASDVSSNDDAHTNSALNMALNSARLMDTSTCSSPTRNESIAETEKVRSPRLLRTKSDWGARRDLLHKFRSKSNEENYNPSMKTNSTLVAATKTDWLSKERTKAVSSAFADFQFIKPQSTDAMSNEAGRRTKKKSSILSLNKNPTPKLRQSRLQLDVSREKKMDATFCDVIEASPHPKAAAAKTSKAARSWILRTSSSVGNLNHTKKDENRLKFDDDDDDANDDDDKIFDFAAKIAKCAAAAAQSKEDAAAEKPNESVNVTFDIRPETQEAAVPTIAELTSNISLPAAVDKCSDSPSVVLLTPAEQEVIFLDDTSEDENNSAAESMDLLLDLIKSADDTINLEQLKRIENEKIITLQREASTLKPANIVNMPEPEPIASTSKALCNLKAEKVTQIVAQQMPALENAENAQNANNEIEESEPFLVRPMLVKEEPIASNTPAPVLSIKERFNIDCEDCQNYIEFLGNQLSDKEIEHHLRQCTRHKKREVFRQQTPEGFWNPFMESFAEDDPRNEVLIDNRFVGKKRGD